MNIFVLSSLESCVPDNADQTLNDFRINCLLHLLQKNRKKDNTDFNFSYPLTFQKLFLKRNLVSYEKLPINNKWQSFPVYDY